MDRSLAADQAVATPTEAVFRAMADPTRRRLLQLLLREELNVTELVAVLRQPQSTISRHLKVLRDAGMVADRRSGTAAIYGAVPVSDHDRSLQSLILTWLHDRPLSATLERRLQQALSRREYNGVTAFERLGRRWDRMRAEAFGETFALEALIHLLPAEWTVADLGTGTGYLLPALAGRFRQVIAVEPAATMLRCARERVAQRRLANVEVRKGRLEAIPLEAGACDLVMACLVLHHIAEPRRAIEEMHRVLKPGGRALIVEQHAHTDQDFHDAMQDYWWGFEPQALCRTIEAAGLSNVDQRPLQSAPGRDAPGASPGLFVVAARRPIVERTNGQET